MKIFVSYNKKKIPLDVYKTGFFRKGLGLMFRTKQTRSLLFEFSKPITWQGNLTSIFVFFPFLTLWLDDKNRVIDFKIIKPFVLTIKQKKKFSKIVEIPINKKNKSLIVRFIKNKIFNHYFRR